MWSDVLFPENRETVSGCGGTHAGGSILGKCGEHLQANDQVHHRDTDRRLRQGTEWQGQVLVVLVIPRIRYARDRPRSCEMLTAPRVGLASHIWNGRMSADNSWEDDDGDNRRSCVDSRGVNTSLLRFSANSWETRNASAWRFAPPPSSAWDLFPPRAGLAIKRLRILRTRSWVNPSGSLRKNRAATRSERAARLSHDDRRVLSFYLFN